MASEGRLTVAESEMLTAQRRNDILSEQNRLLMQHNTYTAAMESGSLPERISYFIANLLTVIRLDNVSRRVDYTSNYFR